ncbi:MAG: universal stress protein [Cyanobacteria bacterium J06635_1]
MFNRILVALEVSSSSRFVLEEAIAIAQRMKGCLNLISVVYPLESGYPDPIYLSMDGFHSVVSTEAYESYVTDWQRLKDERLGWLRSQAEAAQRQGIKADYTQLLGDPGLSICDLAQHWNADLIVMGRRGRSGLSELILGSVSNYVMHHAPCSVLTVQGQPEQLKAVDQPVEDFAEISPTTA